MPTDILSQNSDELNLYNAITSFFTRFGIGKLFPKCNANKAKGIHVTEIFKYKLCNAFADRSMYMQIRTGSYKESFAKNT